MKRILNRSKPDDTDKTISKSFTNPSLYCTTFGALGSYYDHITDILSENPDLLSLIDLSVTDDEIYKIIKESGFNDKKTDGIVKWIISSIAYLKSIVQ